MHVTALIQNTVDFLKALVNNDAMFTERWPKRHNLMGYDKDGTVWFDSLFISHGIQSDRGSIIIVW